MAKAKKMKIPDTITKKYFVGRVGSLPINDDLERCNCKEAGRIGHFFCGWCKNCDLPVFICGHIQTNENNSSLSLF